jgi:hypothetical protein
VRRLQRRPQQPLPPPAWGRAPLLTIRLRQGFCSRADPWEFAEKPARRVNRGAAQPSRREASLRRIRIQSCTARGFSADPEAPAEQPPRRAQAGAGSIRSWLITRLGPGLDRAESGFCLSLDQDSAMHPASHGPEAALLIRPAGRGGWASSPRSRPGLPAPPERPALGREGLFRSLLTGIWPFAVLAAAAGIPNGAPLRRRWPGSGLSSVRAWTGAGREPRVGQSDADAADGTALSTRWRRERLQAVCRLPPGRIVAGEASRLPGAGHPVLPIRAFSARCMSWICQGRPGRIECDRLP